MVAHHKGRRLEGGVNFFIRPREAGEGDHWSSRSERTVVEGAPDSQPRHRRQAINVAADNTLNRRGRVESRAPSTTLLAQRGPPSPLSRGRMLAKAESAGAARSGPQG